MLARFAHGRLYYGWVIVATLAITETISWGILYYTFAVVLPAMEHELHWSRVAMTGALSAALLASGIAAPLVGRWLDRRGPRLLMTVGACVATGLVLAWSQTSQLPAFYLIWIGIGITMAMLLYEPAFVVVNTWFVRQRSRALSIVTFVAAFASTIFIPLATELSERFGWRAAILVLAIILGVGTIPLHLLVLRRRPADLGLSVDGEPYLADVELQPRRRRDVSVRAALRDRTFWWLTTGFTLTTLAAIAITIHLIPYLLDHGYDARFAALAASIIGAMKFPGRLAFAPLERRIPHPYLAAVLVLLQGVAVLILMMVPGTSGVLCGVALFGAASGAGTLARPALLAEHYGQTHYGRINGVIAFFLAGAQALAPVGSGALYMVFGRYEPVLWIVILIFALAFGAVLRTEQPRLTVLAAS
ncbi:MFS transporter [Kouleothrix sp.]|uniref:MFS transporter n=1 Tax=Kouleothrix sp. TaxID=2779161 RepID=UPI003919C14B